jgi:hypothetical protein
MISGLESARLKIDRVAVHLNDVRNILRNYLGSEPNAITVHPDGSKDLNFIRDIPTSIPIIAGEIIYQLRSALDHLTFDLVKLNSLSVQLPKRWEERCQFPLLLNVPAKGTPPVPLNLPLAYNHFEDLPGISKEAFAFIESTQPYNGGDVALGLRYLASLSNIDKHRYPHITKPHAFRRDEHTVRYRGGIYHGSREIRVDDGTKTQSPGDSEMEILHVQVDGVFTPFVSFDESALGPNAPNLAVEDVLQSCLDAVDLGIVSTFAEFMKKP